jgi:hypothetical protein
MHVLVKIAPGGGLTEVFHFLCEGRYAQKGKQKRQIILQYVHICQAILK